MRKKILQGAWAKLKNRRLFDYYWNLRSVVEMPIDNAWGWETFFKLIELSELDEAGVQNIVKAGIIDGNTVPAPLLDYIENSPQPIRTLFFKVIMQEFLRDAGIMTRLSEGINKHLFQSLSLKDTIALVSDTPDFTWNKLKNVVFERLKELQSKSNFWKTVFNKIIDTDSNSQLNSRLLEDKDFFELFLSQESTDILDINHPIFESVIFQWIQKHAHIFEFDKASFYKSCVHKLPQIRHWALAKVDFSKISTSFAINLIESGLPDTEAKGKAYFEGLESGTIKEFEAILALCDSPHKVVRAYGLEMLSKRKNNLVMQDNEVWEYLSEHADSEIQKTVAEELLENKIEKPFVQRFDKEILRMKHRSRKAKEKVKNRIDQSLSIKPEVLLELAQSKNKQDAEWAIFQLTKLSLAGESIEGFELK